eukprot:2336538-Prymnesium_polylepis.1
MGRWASRPRSHLPVCPPGTPGTSDTCSLVAPAPRCPLMARGTCPLVLLRHLSNLAAGPPVHFPCPPHSCPLLVRVTLALYILALYLYM